jgi:hypothetical protein
MHDPIYKRTERFLHFYDALRRRFRWTDSTTMRFSALGLSFVPDSSETAVARLDEIAETIKRRSGVFSDMKGAIRFPLASLLLRRGGDPSGDLDLVDRYRQQLTDAKLRGGVYASIAAFLMLGPRPGHEAPPGTASRVRQLFDRMKRQHRFLTNSQDLPMAVALVISDESIPAIDTRLETIYRRLVAARAGRTNATQLAAQILALGRSDPATAVSRFRSWQGRLSRVGLPSRSSAYDEIALLSLLPRGVVTERSLAATVAHVRGERLFKIAKSLSLSLAVGLHIGALSDSDPALCRSLASDLLLAVQQAVEAQQAAVMAACVTAVVVSSAARG